MMGKVIHIFIPDFIVGQKWHAGDAFFYRHISCSRSILQIGTERTKRNYLRTTTLMICYSWMILTTC